MLIPGGPTPSESGLASNGVRTAIASYELGTAIPVPLFLGAARIVDISVFAVGTNRQLTGMLIGKTSGGVIEHMEGAVFREYGTTFKTVPLPITTTVVEIRVYDQASTYAAGVTTPYLLVEYSFELGI